MTAVAALPPAAALAALSVDREASRLAAVLAGLLLVPVVLAVLVVAAVAGAVAGGGPARGLPPAVPVDQLAVMSEVSATSGVPWPLLAAVASVESDLGRNMATSTAGAIGYGQFLPASWAAYGRGGDPYDFRDAIPAMARYLADHGAPADVAGALYAYNHSWSYVALVLSRAAAYTTLGPDPAAAVPVHADEVAP